MPPSDEYVNRTFNQFIGDVYSYVKKGHSLPFRGYAIFPTRYASLGVRMAKEKVGESLKHNKRKALGPMAGVATGVVAAKVAGASAAALGVGAIAGGPVGIAAVGIALGAGITASILGAGVIQAKRTLNYYMYRAKLDSAPFDRAHINIDKLASVVSGGELSLMARSFEKACEARDQFRLYKIEHQSDLARRTCRMAAEYAARLLYWHKRNGRLMRGDAEIDVSMPETDDDHRYRNVLEFVKLVPRDAYASAESALAHYGQNAVSFMERARTSGRDKDSYGKRGDIRDEGLLHWHQWSLEADKIWAERARFERHEEKGPDEERINALHRRLGAWTLRGRTRGDPGDLVRGWHAMERALRRVREGDLGDVDDPGARARRSHGRGEGTSRVGSPLSLGVGGVLKPSTSLIVQEFAKHAVQNPSTWAHGAATGAVGIVPAFLASTATSLFSETLNSRLNMGDILNPLYDPAKKVWKIRSVLEFGGVAEVMKTSGLLGQSIRLVSGLDAQISVRQNARAQSVEYLKQMFEELYRLHSLLVRLAVQMTLWEIMIQTIESQSQALVDQLAHEFGQFETAMKNRLRNDNYHQQCKTICYYDMTGDGLPDKPLT